MKDTIKRHLISFLVTFAATFILVLAPSIQTGSWDVSFLLAVVIAAARSAFKVAYEFAILPLMNILIDWAGKLKDNK